MSKQYDKYQKIYQNVKTRINKEPDNFVFCDNLYGIKSVFLLQNMFPTTEEYLREEYLIKGQEVIIPIIIQQAIISKARTHIYHAKKGIVTTYTNLPEFIKEIEKELLYK